MLFNSFEFLLFLPLVIILYYCIPHKYRWILLLIASYYFYMCWKAEYIILIAVSSAIDYYTGLKMSGLKKKKQRKKYLYLSLVVNLGLLFGFKYFNFFNESVREVFEHFNIFYGVKEFKVLLPVGISFYTFQTLSYTIDIYRGTGKVEKHPGIFAVYVSFFPQLVAGPIERARNLLPQFRQKISFDYNSVTSGLKLMLWGFFKKVVIADRIGIFVNHIYSDSQNTDGISIYIASALFMIQIYCDFSGYSDIAIGSARIMGIKLMRNFNRPLISRSISEFWERWHISLNTWFRDYVLFEMPFGKNKKLIKLRLHINLVITVLLIGLWHGANWTYVLWGAVIALYMIADIYTKSIRKKIIGLTSINKLPVIHKLIDILALAFFINLAAIFFRAASFQDITVLFSNLLKMPPDSGEFIKGLYHNQFLLISLLVSFLFIFEYLHDKYNIASVISRLPLLIRLNIYAASIIVIALLGVFTREEFIYFQF